MLFPSVKMGHFILLATCCLVLVSNGAVSGQFMDLLEKAQSVGEQAISGVATPVEKVVVATTLKKCDVFKAIFGVGFDQLKGSKSEPDVSKLTIDLCTKSKKIKYNITEAGIKLLEDKEFDVNKPLVIFLHGFLASADGEGAKTVTKSLVSRGDINVLALDSSSLIMYFYLWSSTCVRFIGNQLGITLALLVEGGIKAENVHVVGHSLGAHIAGFAGKTFTDLTGQKIGHITGLDPAGPCFFQEKVNLKLVDTDATFIDVIHTDAGVLGLVDPLGHVDFYPNDGEKQPGCAFPPCSHSRAWALYSASVEAEDRFPAVKCVSWDVFLSESCEHNEKAYMGYGVNKTVRGKFYLTTAGKAPFGFGGPPPPQTTATPFYRKIF